MATGGPTLEDYEQEEDRILSFIGWPPNAPLQREQLASVGFIYTGVGTLVRCFRCGIQYRAWQQGDDPFLMHQRCNPRCSFLRTLAYELEPSIQAHHTQPSTPEPQDQNAAYYMYDEAVSITSLDTEYDVSLYYEDSPNNTHRAENYRQVHGQVLDSQEDHGREQIEINRPVEAETSYLASSWQPRYHQSALPHYHQSSMPNPLPHHPHLMEFPPYPMPPFADTSLLRQYHYEQSQLEDRGSIDPYRRLDAGLEMASAEQVEAFNHVTEAHQPRAQQGEVYNLITQPRAQRGAACNLVTETHRSSAAENHVSNSLPSNADILDLRMLTVTLKNSPVLSSFGSSNDENNKVNGGINPADNKINVICQICRKEVKSFVLLHCGHTTCERCARQSWESNKWCPHCRCPLSEKYKIYISDTMCEICYTEVKSSVLIPCGHMTCEPCADEIWKSKCCPHCRSHLSKVIYNLPDLLQGTVLQ